jgi:hypothetical protein
MSARLFAGRTGVNAVAPDIDIGCYPESWSLVNPVGEYNAMCAAPSKAPGLTAFAEPDEQVGGSNPIRVGSSATGGGEDWTAAGGGPLDSAPNPEMLDGTMCNNRAARRLGQECTGLSE